MLILKQQILYVHKYRYREKKSVEMKTAKDTDANALSHLRVL